MRYTIFFLDTQKAAFRHTQALQYLGSYISYSLQEDYDIKSRIAAATKAFGALTKFGTTRCWHLHKYLIFRAIPMNSLLWGCEAWSLRKIGTNKTWSLSTNIRRILQISMFQVKRERITNDQVRKRFYDIQCVENMIAAWLLSFIGKAVRNPHPLPCLQKTPCHSDTIIRHPSHKSWAHGTTVPKWPKNTCRRSHETRMTRDS